MLKINPFLLVLCLSALGHSVSAAELQLVPAAAKQGQVVEVLLSGFNEPPPPVTFRDGNYRAFPLRKAGSSVYRALVCVPTNLDPGQYRIKCGEHEQALKVVSGGYPVQSIRLPKGKDTFDGSPGEKATVDAAKRTVTDEQLWQGKFVCPCRARVSAGFGLKRSVNGKLLKDYFHSGIDYAGFSGAPVYAAQDGRVLLSHNGWKLHGNTICLDHGQGVLSFYIHLSKILAKEGQAIKAGEKIGAVGSTGRANGPHLHFSIYVNNEACNPNQWFAKSF
ncbi:MAG: M23 family metallopeptidase [Candidatus Obscuribacterales bacterium]|nr:M23 family metallopeptidase [Candidatus Obscuribacterales bacterium]